jgi:hypothetical protein
MEKMMRFTPKIEILPPAQQALWPLLHEVPSQFVLYGGTAIALRYGHRQSVDFDFFTTKDFNIENIMNLPFIKNYTKKIRKHHENFFNFTLDIDKSDHYVDISFINTSETIMPASVNPPDNAIGNNIKVASPLDLMVGKIFALQDRSTKKDLIDLAVLIEEGTPLQRGFEAAYAISKHFSPGEVSQKIGSSTFTVEISLKAKQ